MNRDQIKSLINRKIFGQGNQVDLGTALPNILNAIMDLGASTEEVDDFENFDPETSYAEGDIVRKDGKLYKFTTNHDGEWEFADVEQTNVMEILGGNTPSYSTILEVGYHELVGIQDWDEIASKYSLISILNSDDDNSRWATILPISHSKEVLFEFQEHWSIGTFEGCVFGEESDWEGILDYIGDNGSPIVTENNVLIKPFTLLAEPTEDMTTLEQLATTGLTEEILIDISRGRYSCILIPVAGKYERMPIVWANNNELVFGYYIGGSFDKASIYGITISGEEVVIVERLEL